MLKYRERIVSEAGKTAGTHTGAAVSLRARKYSKALFRLIPTTNSIGSLTVALQHNPDPNDDTKGGWVTFATFTAVTSGSAVQEIIPSTITQAIFPNIRAVGTVASGNFDYVVDAHFGE